MKRAIGAGLTNACTFSCRHCYSGGGRNPVHMDIGILLRFIEKCGADSINLGTGESCLHPEFHGALEEFHRRDIPVALTTAGPSVEAMSDTELSRLHDIDFSLDFPGEDLHDRWRAPGAFKMVMDGISRCRKLGVTASVAMCLMEQNAGFMEAMCRLCDSLGSPYGSMFTRLSPPGSMNRNTTHSGGLWTPFSQCPPLRSPRNRW